MTRRGLRHRLEYGLYRVLSGLLRGLPESWALGLGALLGWKAGVVFRIRRRAVDAHLELAFPDRSEGWRRRVARASFAHLGREAVAMLRMADLDPSDLRARTTVEGLEAFESARSEGRGVIVVSGHLGNWEIGAAALTARGIPVEAVAKGMANRRFDEELVRTRRRLGVSIVGMEEAPRRVLRALSRGEVTALVADQNFHRDPVFVPFFGRLAATARGPAVFALRTGAPVFLGVALREDDAGSGARYRTLLQPIDFRPSGDHEADVRRLTEVYTAALEELIRAHPEQYFWQHKRWKHRPPPVEGGEPVAEELP